MRRSVPHERPKLLSRSFGMRSVMVGAMMIVKDRYKILIAAAGTVVLIWVLDAAYHAVVSREGSFLQLLSEGTIREPLFHVVLAVALLWTGVLAFLLLKQRKAESAQKKHMAAIESSMDGIAIFDRNGTYVHANQAYASISGYSGPEEVIGKTCEHFYGEEELARMEQVCMPVLQKSGRWRGELVAKRKNGSMYFQEASISMLEDGGRVCIIRDISWRKRSEKRLLRSEHFLNTIFDSIRDPFCIFDRDFRVVRHNEAYARMKDRLDKELIGNKCHEVLHGRGSVCAECIVDRTFQSGDHCVKEKNVRLRDGSDIWVEIYTYPILDEEGTVSHAIEYTRNITDRKRSEEEKREIIRTLEHLSSTDSLTGLVNRRALTESLMYEIDRARRYNSHLSLMLCDIDNFKEINDTFGHEAGDRALQAISTVLKDILRKTDIAGRHGGDEFMIILPETSIRGAEYLADKILLAVRDIDVRLKDGRPVRLSTSIGISALEAGVDSPDSFIKRADEAMYASKQGGRDRVSTARPYPLFP
ncbi:MAG TPA: diguanylate cyclase [Nitrospirota bacterium]